MLYLLLGEVRCMIIRNVGDCFWVVIFCWCMFLGRCVCVWVMWFCIFIVVLFGLVFGWKVMVICSILFELVIDLRYIMFLMLLMVFLSGVVMVLVIIFGFVFG